MSEELDIAHSEAVESELEEFSCLYFGKPMKELTSEENLEIDSIGLYGISEWLIDYENGSINGKEIVSL